MNFFLATLMLVISLVLFQSPAQGDESVPDLITDRPTRAANTATVQPGNVLWETGFKFSRNDTDGELSDEIDFLDSVIRIGLVQKAELRLGWLSGKWKETSSVEAAEESTGIGDASLGLKFRFNEEKGSVPQIALLFSTVVPIGDDEFTSDRFHPSAVMAFSHTLPSSLGLVYNVGVLATSGQDEAREIETHTYFDYSAALSYGRNPLFAPFLEAFGAAPITGNGSSSFSLGGGITSLVFSNFQLDASGGIGLTDSATDWFVGIGFSLRIPR